MGVSINGGTPSHDPSEFFPNKNDPASGSLTPIDGTLNGLHPASASYNASYVLLQGTQAIYHLRAAAQQQCVKLMKFF